MMVRSTTTSVQQSATKSKCERNVDTDDDSSQSLSDDENHLYKILTNLKNSNENQELGNTEQYVIDALSADASVCLICIETIEKKQPIWNCEGCYAQFHIGCIQNWIRDGSYLVLKPGDDGKPKEIPWNCPKCRREYPQKSVPTIYYCYCRKQRDPTFDPWSIPHSCNQVCAKPKPCSHVCLTICHPGPCPPCPKMVTNSCFCQKAQPVSRRCANKQWSCQKPCNRLMPCKQHVCEQVCHAGSCGECSKTSKQFCRCKRQRKEVECTETKWECGEVCDKPLTCGHHVCERVCHDGECGACPKSLRRSCPCGKTTSRKPCTVDIPTCGDTCDKPLECGQHTCTNRCHFGRCDPCRQVVKKRCQCGQAEKTLPCHVEFTCDIKCNKMRNCGKHKCSRKCCDGNCMPCEQICGKTLSCKNHKCKSLCHSGPCYPCPIIVERFCPCGSSKLKIPCSKSNAQVKVLCKDVCKAKAKCHHERIQTHRCHYDKCPPCKIKCGLTMKCGHVCPNTCHGSVLTQVIENKDRDGPWIPLTVREEYKKLECSDCLHPVPVECFGKHEMSELPCYCAKPFNCGRPCGVLLQCTRHTCELDCHVVKKQSDEKDKSQATHAKYCEQCTHDCELRRPSGCQHPCPIGHCHPADCPKCAKLNKFRCHCKANYVYVECDKWTRANEREQNELKSCRVPCTKTISCGHQCSLNCHASACSSAAECTVRVTVKCACKTLKRSVICNQLEGESDIKLANDRTSAKGGSEKKYVLACNEKCASLKAKRDGDKANSQGAPTEQVVTSGRNGNYNGFASLSMVYLLAALFVVILAVLAIRIYTSD